MTLDFFIFILVTASLPVDRRGKLKDVLLILTWIEVPSFLGHPFWLQLHGLVGPYFDDSLRVWRWTKCLK